MKFTLSWLKDHLETDASLDQITDALTELGLEVEGVENKAAELAGFVVAHIQEAARHPDADRLQVCKVDTGKGVIQVVCGAPNARAGLKVILAQPGVVIPVTGEALKKGNVRGVESQGMMCSYRELGLGEDHDGIAELAADAVVGQPITSVLNFDPVIEIAITPNRADCLGVRGVARDLAAKGLGTLKPLTITAVAGSFPGPQGLRTDDASACPHFVARIIRGVKNGESPPWLKERLTAIGLRPISALVDITNLVSFDLARPLHVFDAAKVKGALHARLAKNGETLTGLGDRALTLGEDMIVIADESGPVALAGILGGEATGCTADTTDVVLEVALFDPIRIALAGRKLDVLSDARYRFERGVDPAFAVDAAHHATRLILEICGGEASELAIAGEAPQWRHQITLRPERVKQLVGLDVAVARQQAILEALGCEVRLDGHHLLVAPPSWRGDIRAEHDLVEEVARVEGMDAIPALTLPRQPSPAAVLTPAQRRVGWVRRGLAGRGLVEAVTFSFLPRAQAVLFGAGDDPIALANPISTDLEIMRPSVLPNLVAAAGRNMDRGVADPALFEIGAQFFGPEPGQQKLAVAGIRADGAGPRHWQVKRRPVDVFDAKADLLAVLAAAGLSADSVQVVAGGPSWYHPGRSGLCKLGNKVVAQFGELHPKVLADMGISVPVVGFEVFLDDLPLPKVKASKSRPALKASAFQPLDRDFAFVVDSNVAADALVRAAKGADKALITEVRVFDLYEGPGVDAGKKSVALSITLQPTVKTLTDQDIEAVSGQVVAAVAKATGGQLRG